MLPSPSHRYLLAVHIPMFQGEQPTVAVLRKANDDCRIIRVRELDGRSFHDDIMPSLVEIARRASEIDQTPEAHAHLIFTGTSLSGFEVSQLLCPAWKSSAWSYLKIASGGTEPILDSTDERLPLNQFKIPRRSLINAINFAYNQPGTIFFSFSRKEAEDLERQLASFTERTLTVSGNDPDALLEFEGEGRVICLGAVIWHHLNARSLRSGWV